jgi:hypothetical protein
VALLLAGLLVLFAFGRALGAKGGHRAPPIWWRSPARG